MKRMILADSPQFINKQVIIEQAVMRIEDVLESNRYVSEDEIYHLAQSQIHRIAYYLDDSDQAELVEAVLDELEAEEYNVRV